jgi:Ca2+-binding EF-hand superfamily protein
LETTALTDATKFQILDTNRDGVVDMNELTAFLSTNGIVLDHRQWSASWIVCVVLATAARLLWDFRELMLSKLDRNGDGQVTLAEFSRWLSLQDF